MQLTEKGALNAGSYINDEKWLALIQNVSTKVVLIYSCNSDLNMFICASILLIC